MSRPPSRPPVRLLPVMLLLIAVVACRVAAPPVTDGGVAPVADGGVAPVTPAVAPHRFEPRQVEAAARKVKALLVGLPPDEEELRSLSADPAALGPLVRQWRQTPQYRERMLRFFTTEFQQDDWGYSALQYQFCARIPFSRSSEELVSNMQESFGRTALALIDEGRPFSEVLTTTRFMMTPALMAAYGLIEDAGVDDRFFCTRRKLPFSITVTRQPAPLEEALNPAAAGRYVFHGPSEAQYPQGTDLSVLTELLYGQGARSDRGGADPMAGAPLDTYLEESDFTGWKMVSVQPRTPGRPLTASYDLPALRARNRLVLEIPRVGFFSTPAFAARWPTNKSNQHRVVLNQALIVALGRPVDLTNKTKPHSLATLDAAHASAEADCYGCHQSLDPMRQFFQQSYSQSFGLQRDPDRTATPGEFAFHGVAETGTDIASFGALLARHPLFPTAWVRKLCTWAAARSCDESDPELRRLVAVFEDSHLSWSALVDALFTSPLVTGLSPSAEPLPVVLSRQADLCGVLSARLGVTDACVLDPETSASLAARRDEGQPAGWDDLSAVTSVTPFFEHYLFERLRTSLRQARTVASSWPADRYGRGSAGRSLVTDPSLLTRGGLESLCTNLADRFVDTEATTLFRSRETARALDNLVTRLMGLPAARASVPRAILQEHFDEVSHEGASPTVALRSTFVLACLTPYVAAIGE